LVVGAIAAVRVIRSVMQPLQVAISAAERISNGNLSTAITVTSNDELAHMLRTLEQMRLSLAQVIENIHESAAQVRSASTEIAAANMDLSSRTESQASALQETASSMEQMTRTVQQNAELSQTASELAQQACSTAGNVGEQVNALVQTMQDIHQSSQRIRDIVGVIDSIAFQTNILALNAAVEAARAGEHGRGFAVVASEVRSLAQHSANAAQEIKAIIEDNVRKMDSGNVIAQQAGNSVSTVVESISSVNSTVSQVATATREQSSGIAQMGQAIQSLDETTQQNAALVEETAAASSHLDEQVQRLNETVNRFQLR